MLWKIGCPVIEATPVRHLPLAIFLGLTPNERSIAR
jgi:hypothetical protein